MKIQLEVTGDCEGTDSPYWLILDPRQNMGADVHMMGGHITGPFFSRKEASDFLTATRYNFGKRACVYCLSGTYSGQYKEALRGHGENL